jgi:hypothetical protein
MLLKNQPRASRRASRASRLHLNLNASDLGREPIYATQPVYAPGRTARRATPSTLTPSDLGALKGDDAVVDAQQNPLYLGDDQKEAFAPDFAAWIIAGHERCASMPQTDQTRAFAAYYGFALDGEFETLIWGESEDLALLWSLFARALREGEAL